MQNGTVPRAEAGVRRVCPELYATRLFLLCSVTYIVGLFGRMSYAAVTVSLIADEGFTKSQAGLIGTALFLAYGVGQFFAGVLGDRTPPKYMVFVGVLGSALLNLGMGLTTNHVLMLVLWTLNGVLQSLIWSPIFKVLSEVLPPTYRKRACSNVAATYPLATVITYLFAALALHSLGWRSVFLLSGVLMVGAAFFWLHRMGWYEQEIAAHGETEHLVLTAQEQESGGSLFRLLLSSGALYAVAGAVTLGMLRDGIQSWVPTFMTESFQLKTSFSTALAVLLPLVNIFGVFLTKAAAKRWIHNELRGAAAFFAATTVSLVGLAIFCTISAGGSLAAMIVASTLMVGSNIMLINLLPIHFGAVGRASSVTGVLNCAAYTGSALSSYGVGKVADVFGWRAAIDVWLGFAVLALIITLLGARKWGKYRRNI